MNCSFYEADPMGPFLEQRPRIIEGRLKRYRNSDVGSIYVTTRKRRRLQRNLYEAESSTCQHESSSL
jgi:hypothetical protein